MHIALTDILTCPACGFGLILLSERMEARRVLEGALGCPNCERRYPVRGGFADLRPPPDATPREPTPRTVASVATSPTSVRESGAAEQREPADAGEDEQRAAFRLAALMGISRGPAYALVAGEGVRHAPAVAAMVEDLELIVVSEHTSDWPEQRGVNRMATTRALPLYDGSLRAVALTWGADFSLEEAARVLARGGRLVWEEAGADAEERLRAAGFTILARQGATVVAARS